MATTLVLTNDFPPLIGGIESFVADACELLDHDVVVLAPALRDGDRGRDVDRGYPVVRGPSLLLPTPATARRAVALLHEHRATRVVFGAAAPLGLLAPVLRRAGAEHLVGLTHGHEVWWATLPGSRQLLHRIGEGCDHLTTISDHTTGRIAPALSPSARARLLRLPPPVDLEQFRPRAPGLPPAPPRCVAVGRFVLQKGFDTLVRAWARVQQAWPDGERRPELVLVGDGPQREWLRAEVGRLGLTGSVRMTGPLPRTAVVAELQAARVFALPVRRRLAGLNAEGLGLAAVEAAACGLPVVVGASGGAPETVREGASGFVVPPEDPDRLAEVLLPLLLDPARAARMGAVGRQHVSAHFGAAAARRTLRRALHLT